MRFEIPMFVHDRRWFCLVSSGEVRYLKFVVKVVECGTENEASVAGLLITSELIPALAQTDSFDILFRTLAFR